MKARIVIQPDGALTIFVDEGTFADAAAAAQRLVRSLGAQVIEAGQPEQHRHDDAHYVHLQEHDHVH